MSERTERTSPDWPRTIGFCEECKNIGPGHLVGCVSGWAESACEHNWADARNSAVESGEICTRCHAIREAESAEEGNES